MSEFLEQFIKENVGCPDGMDKSKCDNRCEKCWDNYRNSYKVIGEEKWRWVVAKRGRPKKIIDYNLVYRLAKRFSTQHDIADILQVSQSRLDKDPEFIRHFKKGKEQCFKNLRVAQYKHAIAGNPSLLIWLGKQYLGQKDTPNEGDLTNVTDKLSAIAKAITKQDTKNADKS